MKRPRLLFSTLFRRKTTKAGGNTPEQGVIAIGVTVVVVFWIVMGAWIFHTRDQAIVAAKRELITLNQVLSADTVRTFDATALVLESVIRELRDLGLNDSVSLRAVSSSALIREMLFDRASQTRFIETITIVSAEGELLAHSREVRLPSSNIVVDRDLSRQMLDDPTPTFVLGRPITSRFSGEMAIHCARPIIDGDGRVVGSVVAILPISYFISLYSSLQLDNGGAISLWHQDGVLIARHPKLPDVGQHVAMDMYRWITPADVPQTYEIEDSLAGKGIPRVVSAKRPDGYPIIVNVGVNRDMVLKAWAGGVAALVATLSIVTFLLGLAIWEIQRRLRVSYQLGQSQKRIEAEVERREEIEEQLRQSQKLEAVGQLTAGIAHDFNNILTVVIGHMDVVRRGIDPASSPMVTKSIDRASTAARKAADLTHRLLAFARKQRLEPISIDVEDLLEEMTSILGRTLGEHVKINFERSGGIWRVFADRNQLENVLVNLAINSRDAMETGGTLSLSVRNAHVPARAVGNDYDGMSGDFVAISVTDTGAGMSPDVLERAFEPFYSTKGIGRGSGLGLSQVYGFSKQSGGSTIIESEMGVGTTVTVYLPRSHDVEIRDEAPPVGDYPQGSRETVLVVDDNDDLREFAITALGELNYKVLHAGDASEALAILRLNKVDVLLADIGLPGMSGTDLGKEAERTRPGIEVIYMTGYAVEEIGDASGIARDRVVIKPFTYRNISEKMRDVLAERRVRTAVAVR